MPEFNWQADSGPMWLARLFLLVAVTAAADQLLQWLLRHLQNVLRGTRARWDETMLQAARAPLRLLIWILGLALALDMLDMRRQDWPELVDNVRRVGVIAAIAWFAFRATGGWQTWRISQLQQGHADPTAILAIGRLLRASIVITGALVILETLGFSISGVLAFGGIGGVAVGFAAKDMLANFFGGLMIFLDRPFTVGDWIRSPDREIEGIVEQIGWRITVVRNFDKEPVYIPNSTFSSIAVVTPSRMSHRRIRETLGLRYADLPQLQPALQAMRDYLRQHEKIAADMGVIVHLDRYADSSLDVLVQCYTPVTVWSEYMALREHILLQLAHIAGRYGVEFAFPVRVLALEPAQNDQWQRMAEQSAGR